MTDRWRHIGLALRLDPSELKTIEKEKDNLEDCLTEVLTLWLKKAYNYDRFGEPSWELLVRAVHDPAGGNNPAVADKIAKKYGKVKNSRINNTTHASLPLSLPPSHSPLSVCLFFSVCFHTVNTSPSSTAS